MRGFFSLDNPFFSFLSRVADLMLISVLCLLCCVPVVTVGAAVTAAHKVIFDIHHQQDSGIIRPFFSAFRENFGQATAGWIVYLLTLAFLVLDVMLVRANCVGTLALVLTFVILIVLLLVFANMCYFFPILSRYTNTLPRHLYNCFLLSLGELPRTLALIVLQLSPLLVYLLSPMLMFQTLLGWILIGFGLVIFLQQWILKPLFRKLEKTPDSEPSQVK